MTTLVTGYNLDGWFQYGQACNQSFLEHWPRSYRLIVYSEEALGLAVGKLRFADDIPELVTFRQRYAGSALYRGEKPIPGKAWKAKYVQRGYNFRFDAVKFSKMVLYTFDAARRQRDGILCWMDGDVRTKAPVPEGFVEDLLPLGYDCAYLGRPTYSHSETGFVVFRLPAAKPLIDAWASFYITGEFVDMMESHSAYLFDRARERVPSVQCLNIAGTDRRRYWTDSPLGPYLEHLKGRRKQEIAK